MIALFIPVFVLFCIGAAGYFSYYLCREFFKWIVSVFKSDGSD